MCAELKLDTPYNLYHKFRDSDESFQSQKYIKMNK